MITLTKADVEQVSDTQTFTSGSHLVTVASQRKYSLETCV